MIKGLVADIQRASFHDGTGIRTTVFLKGCPLRCEWCHNPECISPIPETLFYKERCIGCGKCNEGCFSGARKICGSSMTAADVLREVLSDRAYYGENGGVTFSGGEPLMQLAFLRDCIAHCKQEKIHCAVETSLIIYDEEVFRSVDLVMADLKIWEDGLHRRYTGVGNAPIKEHFQRLNALGVPIIARTPILPEIDQGIDRISEFLKKLENVKQYELLPYHPIGNAKREAMGLEPPDFSIPTRETMEELKQYVFLR